MRRKRQAVRLLPHRQVSGLFVRNGEYIADIKPDQGGRVTRKLGTERERALSLFDSLLVDIGAHDNPLLIDYLAGPFLRSQKHLKSYVYSERCVQWLTRFVESEAKGLRLRDINRSHVERLRVFYSHLAPQTLNNMTQKLKQAMYHAVDVGVLDANRIARMKRLPVDNRRVKFLSLDDFRRILHEARNTDARDLFLTIALTGLRPSNVRLLTTDEVDGDIIRIPPEKMKNGRWGIIPISASTQGVLQARDASPYYFPARGRTGRPKSIDNLSRSYRSIARRVDGVEWSTLYDLRHFFASLLAKHGATEQQIGRLLCHVGQTVTSRYVHHDIEDLRPLVEAHGERVRVALERLHAAATGAEEAIRV